LADYGREYDKIRAAGAELAAISVDTIEQASAMKRDLELPFQILCDTDRKTITAWNLVNHAEGDIAFPAAFIIDRDLRVRWRTAERTTARADPAQVCAIVTDLAAGRKTDAEGRSRAVWPGTMFLRAGLNALSRGFKSR
jgi:peroxiredoxin